MQLSEFSHEPPFHTHLLKFVPHFLCTHLHTYRLITPFVGTHVPLPGSDTCVDVLMLDCIMYYRYCNYYVKTQNLKLIISKYASDYGDTFSFIASHKETECWCCAVTVAM